MTSGFDKHWHSAHNRPLNRRELLKQSGVGFGGLALASLLAQSSSGSENDSTDSRSNPLAVRPPHFPAKAKRIIFLFMHGGPSQVDTFDYKPELEKDDGKPVPFDKPRVVSGQTGVCSSPHGSSGRMANADTTLAICFLRLPNR